MPTDPTPTLRRATELLAIGFVLTYLAAFLALSPRLDWPNSLDLPAADALTLVVAERGGLLLGHSLYLASTLLLVVLAMLLSRVLGLRPGPVATAVVAVGVVSAALQALGVARWLFAVPTLADGYLEAAPASPACEAALVTYAALNDYAGGVGEILGGALTGAGFALLVSVGLRGVAGPRWLVGLGVATAPALVLGLPLDVFGVLGAVLSLIWIGALGVHLTRSSRADRAEPRPTARRAEEVGARARAGSSSAVALPSRLSRARRWRSGRAARVPSGRGTAVLTPSGTPGIAVVAWNRWWPRGCWRPTPTTPSPGTSPSDRRTRTTQ